MARKNGEPLALLIGGCLGWVAGGWLGAGLGLAAGFLVDRAVLRGQAGGGPGTAADPRAPSERAEAMPRQDSLGDRFFRAAFLTLGHLCKADGRVTREEIRAAERVMQRMSLSPERRREAMQLFREGKAEGVTLDRCLLGLGERLTGQPELALLFLEIMLTAGWAEGAPGAEKRQLLQALAARLDINPLEYARAEAQVASDQRANAANGRPDANALLADAYRTLGVPPTASDSDVRRAYRRLLSRHHPDKLIAQGLPNEWVSVANEHTHQVRRAWEAISQARGLR
jgi:DnaJ like chaperone protein